MQIIPVSPELLGFTTIFVAPRKLGEDESSHFDEHIFSDEIDNHQPVQYLPSNGQALKEHGSGLIEVHLKNVEVFFSRWGVFADL